jgi:predicted XRE-type DNA-binding protein
MWELVNGPIPDGKQVLHKCDNPPCCNPWHLFLGTVADNMSDMVEKSRQSKKIEDEEVVEIRKRYAEGGISQRKLAEEFGIKQMQVSRIVRRVRRREVY